VQQRSRFNPRVLADQRNELLSLFDIALLGADDQPGPGQVAVQARLRVSFHGFAPLDAVTLRGVRLS
jgi:hypothetical protein